MFRKSPIGASAPNSGGLAHVAGHLFLVMLLLVTLLLVAPLLVTLSGTVNRRSWPSGHVKHTSTVKVSLQRVRSCVVEQAERFANN